MVGIIMEQSRILAFIEPTPPFGVVPIDVCYTGKHKKHYKSNNTRQPTADVGIALKFRNRIIPVTAKVARKTADHH